MNKYLLSLVILCTMVLSLNAQDLTSSENYVYSRTYLEPVITSSTSVKQVQEVNYIDGLGRPKQNISIKITPSGKDIISSVEYDVYGRQLKNMLPLPQQGTNNGGIFTSPNLAGAVAVYGNASNYYSEKKIENSPLNRLQEVASPGDAWKMGTGKTVKYSYESNMDSEVRKFMVTTSWSTVSTISVANPAVTISTENTEYASGGYYKRGTLYKNTVTDEDGSTVTTFTNTKDQAILIRKNDGSQNVDTYYVYDEYGQKVAVIPPLAVQNIANAGNIITSAILDNLCYQYKYDNEGRLVEKQLPGKDFESMLYDQQDRLVGVQDANLRKQGQWLYTKYDKFGRVAITGISTGGSRVSEQILVNLQTLNNVGRTETVLFTQQGMNVCYDNSENTYPKPSAWIKLLSLNYYDTYPQETPAIPGNILGQNTLSSEFALISANNGRTFRSTNGLATASYVKNIEDDNWTKNYSYYDLKGRVIGTHSINHLGGYTQTESMLDFAGVPQAVYTYHVRKSGEAGVSVKERFVYDNGNRLKEHYHQVDGKPEQLLTKNSYNELLQLVNKEVGNNLQSIDYTYNIRGWMTAINPSQMPLPDLGGKLFAYKIRYNQKEGIENPDLSQFAGKNVVPKYNGNIAEVDWRAVTSIGANPPVTPKRYGYVYDGLNRLSAAYYQNPTNAYSKENIESLSYDLNGNITNLYRTALFNTGSNTATVIDNLTYSYSGNRVVSINDVSNNVSGYEGGGSTISYDVNGNMKDMMDKKIVGISYNYLNLPNSFTRGPEFSTTNLYRADGMKLHKRNVEMGDGINGVVTSTTDVDYLDGFQYNHTQVEGGGNPGGGGPIDFAMSPMRRAMEIEAFSIEERKTSGKTLELKFFPTAEGFYDYEKDQYIYQYKDHLGNVRLSFGRNSTGVLEITDANDYYPFGMNHLKSGNAFFGQSTYKNYKYNGKELQETGMYDYGARMYMPDIGRWGVVDPLAFLYFQKSPYNYAANNPIMFVDPNGKQIIGSTKEDAQKAQEDINKVFADKRFDNFRTLISIKGKIFNQIDETKLKDALSNADLSVDDKALMETVANTINSKDEHLVEYVNEKDNVSNKATEALGIPSYLDKDKMQEKFGGIPASIYAAGGGSVTGTTKKGTFSLIVSGVSGASDYKDSTGSYVTSPIGREATTGHEIFGHGRSLMTGRGATNQHQDAVKLENLILRVMGHKTIQRDGTDHGPKTTISNASALPGYK